MSVARTAMGLLYIAAGVGHFVLTRTYERIMPDYLPDHRTLVLVSGAAEIAGGVGVLMVRRYPALAQSAAWGLMVLLVCVMPANVWMVQHPEQFPGLPVWAMWLRLPLQLPLIWWAWTYAAAA